MNYKSFTKSTFVLVAFILGILVSSIYVNLQSINESRALLLTNENSNKSIQGIDINEEEIHANEDDFVFFPFIDYTLIHSDAPEPANGWFLLNNSSNALIKADINEDISPSNYVSRNEEYVHFRVGEDNYFYDIIDNEFNSSSNNWRYDYSVSDGSYTEAGFLNIGSMPNYVHNLFYISSDTVASPGSKDNPLFEKRVNSYKDHNELFNIININDDFLIVENVDTEGVFKYEGNYSYINLNQSLKENTSGEVYQASNNGADIKVNNQEVSNNDGNNNYLFESLTPITNNWIDNPELNKFYYYDNSANFLKNESTISYDRFYGSFNEGYQVYEKDNIFNIVRLRDDSLNPYSKQKITNFNKDNIEKQVQTPSGNYYLIEYDENISSRRIRFVDSQKLLNDSDGDLNSNSAIVGRYQDFNDIELLYATDFVFYYLEGGVLKTSFLPWINLDEYNGNYALSNGKLYFDQNLKISLSRSEVSEVELESEIAKSETDILRTQDEDYFYFEINVPKFTNDTLNLKVHFNDSNLKFNFPKMLFYNNSRPEFNFVGDTEEYVTKNNLLKSEEDELFSNVVTSDSIIHIDIDDHLIDKVIVNEAEWDVIDGKFDSQSNEDYVDETTAFNSNVGVKNKLTIIDVFGKEWSYTMVVEETNSEHYLDNYFETDEGQEMLSVSEKNGFDLPSDINTINSEEAEWMYNHSLNITDLGKIPSFDETIQSNLGDFLTSGWYNSHYEEKIPLNRLTLASSNTDNNQSLEDAIEQSVVKSINNNGYLNSVNNTNLTKDDINITIDTKYLNWDTIITVESVSKQNSINSFNLKLDKKFFNFYDISNLDYSEGIQEEVESNFQELVDDKELKKGMTWENAESIVSSSIVEALNEYNEPWTQGKQPSLSEYSISSEDLVIEYQYHESNISKNEILNDIQYFRINIKSSDYDTSIVYDYGKDSEFRIDNSLFDTAGFFFYYKELIFALILLMLLLIFIIGTIFLIPWIKHSKRLKQMKKNQRKENTGG